MNSRMKNSKQKAKTYSSSRVNQLIRLLTRTYPDKSGLNFENNYQLFVAVLLSAQCTDKKVNEVTPALFKKYPDFKSLANAKVKDVEKIIKPINFFRTKSKNLILAAKIIMERFSGELPVNDFKALTELPGCGVKSANVIQACNRIPAFPVDTHVKRVSNRLGLTSKKQPEKISEDLKKIIPRKFWIMMHHALIWHGRTVCKAIRPRCSCCVVQHLCPSFDHKG